MAPESIAPEARALKVRALEARAQGLSVRDLACRRGEALLFEGVSFDLGPGAALLLRGPNGTGKSSLLRILAGLLPAAAGDVAWEGEADPAERGAALHYVGHLEGIRSALTVREQMAFWQRFFGAGAGDAEAALALMGLGRLTGLPVAGLSAGQRKRLALSRLFLSPRPLWLLDEPGNALDADGRALLEQRIAEHRAGGGTVIIATHSPWSVPGAATLDLGPAPSPAEALP